MPLGSVRAPGPLPSSSTEATCAGHPARSLRSAPSVLCMPPWAPRSSVLAYWCSCSWACMGPCISPLASRESLLGVCAWLSCACLYLKECRDGWSNGAPDDQLLFSCHAAPEPDFSEEVLSLDFKQAGPRGALHSSLDAPSSPSTPSSNPFAALVFHKSAGRSAQLPPAPSAHSLDLEPTLPRTAPDRGAPPLRLSGPSLAAEPSPAAPSSASQEYLAASATPVARAAGAGLESLSTPLTLLPAQRGHPESSSSQQPSLQTAPEGTDTGQPTLKARPPPSVFAGTESLRVSGLVNLVNFT